MRHHHFIIAILVGLLALLAVPRIAHGECLDAPVATAAQRALDTGDFSTVAIWVNRTNEHGLLEAFKHARSVRKLGAEARRLTDSYFVDTAGRLHRESFPAACAPLAIDDALVETVVDQVRTNLRERLRDVSTHAQFRRGDVDAGRAYVIRYAALVQYIATLYAAVTTPPPVVEESIPHER
jgi:hypothetical protein